MVYGQRKAMRIWEDLTQTIERVFTQNLASSAPFVELLRCDAGRKLAIEVLNAEIDGNRFFTDHRHFGLIVLGLVQNSWAVSRDKENGLVIGGPSEDEER